MRYISEYLILGRNNCVVLLKQRSGKNGQDFVPEKPEESSNYGRGGLNEFSQIRASAPRNRSVNYWKEIRNLQIQRQFVKENLYWKNNYKVLWSERLIFGQEIKFYRICEKSDLKFAFFLLNIFDNCCTVFLSFKKRQNHSIFEWMDEIISVLRWFLNPSGE